MVERRTLLVRVSSSSSASSSLSKSAKAWMWAEGGRSLFTRATSRLMRAQTSGLPDRSLKVVNGSRLLSAQLPTTPMSIWISATTNGRPSPTTTASRTCGLNFSLFSISAGENREPSASRRTSRRRSITTRWPSSSTTPASPVRSHPPVEGRGCALGILVVPAEQGRAGDEDLARLGDLDRRAHRRLADRLRSHVVVGMEHRDAARLGLAVHLLEVETDGAVETEQL